MTAFLALDGEVIAPDSVSVPRARALAKALESGELPYVTSVSIFRLKTGAEAIIVDVEVERGQEPPVPIQRMERVATVFFPSDNSYPEVLALREDFPHVPHLNCQEHDVPKSLCLYEEPWPEVKLRWTPSGFIERIRQWLALTAEGRLHGHDQLLEPVLVGHFWRIVLPTDLFNGAPSGIPERLLVARTTDSEKFNVLIAERLPPGQRVASEFVATVFQTQPQQHGVIRRRPRSLTDLADLMNACGTDLLAELRQRLQRWDVSEVRKAHLIMVVHFPKTRTAGGPVESRDVWAFALDGRIEDLGAKLGLWMISNGHIAPLLKPDLTSRGENVLLDVLNTSFALSRSTAAALNGVAANSVAVTAIGAGALGSQVVPKLIQSGWGIWTILDNDYLLPHNCARHHFSSAGYVGQPKAELLANMCNTVLEAETNHRGIVVDLLSPGDKATEVRESLHRAGVVIDFSASVAVSRLLARAPECNARRIAVFLNPTGTDLVLLAEDGARTAPLDYLEMLYYREVAANPDLGNHLSRGPERLRYARSCRDLTSTVPEDLVGLHASIASRAIRNALQSDGSTVKIWRTDSELSVSITLASVPTRIEINTTLWRLVTTQAVIDKVRTLRAAKLPNETGGVFIGHFDTAASVAYIVDTIPAPPDSKEYPIHYIRGSAGLRSHVEGIKARTATMLHYMGEWHSHPDGYSCMPSKDDQTVFSWLTRWMQIDGYPGLMLIAGETAEAWFIGEMV